MLRLPLLLLPVCLRGTGRLRQRDLINFHSLTLDFSRCDCCWQPGWRLTPSSFLSLPSTLAAGGSGIAFRSSLLPFPLSLSPALASSCFATERAREAVGRRQAKGDEESECIHMLTHLHMHCFQGDLSFKSASNDSDVSVLRLDLNAAANLLLLSS